MTPEIPEEDLFALSQAPIGMVRHRPSVHVLARGGRLRHRRRAVRTAGLTAVVGTIAASGVMVVRGTGDTNVTEAVDDPTTTEPEPQPLLAHPWACQFEMDAGFVSPTKISPAEISDAMRVLPDWTPDGVAVTATIANRYVFEPFPCPPMASSDPTLELAATDPDGTITATVDVNGPYSSPQGQWTGDVTHPQVRGVDATLITAYSGEQHALEWAEPDGARWEIRTLGIGEADVLAIAEALELDSTPAPGDPPAQLATDALPAGLQVVAQADHLPAPADPMPASKDMWSVTIGELQAHQTGIVCHLEVDQFGSTAGFPDDFSGVGDRPLTVNGAEALWGPRDRSGNSEDDFGPMVLRWEMSPGLVASAGCRDWDAGAELPIETTLQMAESVVPVAPDDPRVTQD